MKEYRIARLRIRANDKQIYQRMLETAGACRFAWNYYLAELNKDNRSYASYEELGKNFRVLRKTSEEHAWLKKYPANIVEKHLKRLNRAFKSKGKPNFKKKNKTIPSFDVRDTTIRFRDNGWALISKIGYVKLIGNNRYKDIGVFKKGTIRQEAGKWYAYLFYEVEVQEQETTGIVGIDRNVGQVWTSDNTKYDLTVPDFDKLEAKYKRLQKKFARQQEGSNRWQITKIKLQSLQAKIRHIREDNNYKSVKAITDKYNVVGIEKLNIMEMTKKQGKRKAKLNRGIRNTNWSGFEKVLKYKAKEVIEVNPRNTSRQCNICKEIDKQNRKNQSKFVCIKCGNTDNADNNAAKNIEDRTVEEIMKRSLIPLSKEQVNELRASGTGVIGQEVTTMNCQIEPSKEGI